MFVLYATVTLTLLLFPTARIARLFLSFAVWRIKFMLFIPILMPQLLGGGRHCHSFPAGMCRFLTYSQQCIWSYCCHLCSAHGICKGFFSSMVMVLWLTELSVLPKQRAARCRFWGLPKAKKRSFRSNSSELRHGPSIFLLKREGGSLSLNALDIDKWNFARYLQF